MGLEILSDMSEILPYPIPNFPLYAGIGRLEAYNQYAVGCHWHSDFEFSLVLEGSMDYFVNGEKIHLETGDGIFVNSRRLHYNYSREQTPCKYLVLTISPSLFPKGLPALDQLMKEKTSDQCSNFVILKKESCQPILALYPKILHEVEQSRFNPFTALSYVLLLCGEVLPLVQSGILKNSLDTKWLSLYDMTGYIHAHYKEQVALSDISSSGSVCRSRCCQLFSTYLGMSPIEYLISYRLEKSRKLLLDTECSIGEAASKCGFSGQSYFTQMFRKVYGITPREYRKSKQ